MLPVPYLLRLDAIGSRYGKLPSQLLRVRDHEAALCLDMACELAARYEASRQQQVASDETLLDRDGKPARFVESQGVQFPRSMPILPEADEDQPPMIGVRG